MEMMEVQKFLSQAKQNKKIEFDSDFGVEIHHLLMKTYGWIPLKEFEELYIPTIINLLEKIVRDAKAQEDEMNKGKKGKRRR